MTIRPLEKNDVAAYRRLRLKGLKESPTAFGSSHWEEKKMPLKFFERRVELTSDRWMMGAFERKKLVGVVGFVRDSGLQLRHKGYIWGMYVVPDFRSKGVGKALFQETLARVETMAGLKWVRLSVATSNTVALRFYEQFGFVCFGEEREALLIKGKFHSEYYMARKTKTAPN